MKPTSALRTLLHGSALHGAANAQTWYGSTKGAWNDGNNWSGNVVPGANAAIAFDGTGINLTTTTGADFSSVNSIAVTFGQSAQVIINTTISPTNQSTGDLTLTVIPEPRAALLGGLGLLALLRRRRD